MKAGSLAKALMILTLVALVAGCGSAPASQQPAAPADQPTAAADQPAGAAAALTKEQVTEALKAEGLKVTVHSWGFGGLDKDAFPQRFKEHTMQEC
jgi:uncharacterized lipoprotein